MLTAENFKKNLKLHTAISLHTTAHYVSLTLPLDCPLPRSNVNNPANKRMEDRRMEDGRWICPSMGSFKLERKWKLNTEETWVNHMRSFNQLNQKWI